MVRSRLLVSTFREIKSSFGRFLAIFSIIALGVGFFAGLKVAREAMVETVEGYLAGQAFYDYRLVSELGYDRAGVEWLAGQDGVAAAEGSLSFDALYRVEGEEDADQDGEGSQGALKIHSLTGQVNLVKLTAGRLPQAKDECVVDSNLFGEDVLGKYLVLSKDNDQETFAHFAGERFLIVGIVQSPLYLQYERGNTSLGTGRLSGFAYLLPEGFAEEYYTEIYARFDRDFGLYSQAYKDYLEETKALWEDYASQAAMFRYERILADAEEELSSAREEFEEKKAQGEAELSDAAASLAEGEARIADGEEQLEEGKKALAEGERQLSDARSLLEQKAQELADGKAALEEKEKELSQAQQALEEGVAEWQKNSDSMDALEAARAQILEGERAYGEAAQELSDAQSVLEEKRRELKDAEADLAEARAEYQEGLEEYQKGKAEFDAEVADAQRDLSQAQQEIQKLSPPEVYLLGRDTNVGYVCFESDSGIVEGIANIFPLFFILVAALVCVTTMNRMVEEQRTQIGVLKALGYGQGAVMSKYMIYSGLASVTGCVLGFFAGTWLFPRVIWAAYGIMYRAEELRYVLDGRMGVFCLGVALVCSLGTTWLSCRAELTQAAAQLMRPKAPKAGKRVFLERIPFFWNRLSFLRKVSLRNIFRYKKRLFMMVLGISGCTALLVTGFGIKDSIADIADKQFGEIQKFDLAAALKEPATEETKENLERMADSGVDRYLCVMEKNMDLVTEAGVKSLYLIVGDGERMPDFVDLHTKDGESIPYPGPGECTVSDKIADQYHILPGDVITLRDEAMEEMHLTVAAIQENYIYNYVHISPKTWEDQMGEEFQPKTVYADAAEGTDVHEAAAALWQMEGVSNVTVNADTCERVGSMMDSLDIIVLAVIVSAAGLAFIVLYNLTNINITERIREIATIKVLGFYRRETQSYVFRENLLLAAMGMAAGLFLGKWLHAFVMSQIKIDMIAFDVSIRPISYVYSAFLTMGFAWAVGKAMGGKLEGVSMTESLKSVD